MLRRQLENSEREKEELRRCHPTSGDERLNAQQIHSIYEAETMGLRTEVMALRDICKRQSALLDCSGDLNSAGSSTIHAASDQARVGQYNWGQGMPSGQDSLTFATPDTTVHGAQLASDLMLWLIMLGAHAASQPSAPTTEVNLAALPRRVKEAGRMCMESTVGTSHVVMGTNSTALPAPPHQPARSPSSTTRANTSRRGARALHRATPSFTAPGSVPTWLAEELAELQEKPESRLTERRRKVSGAAAAARAPEELDLAPDVVNSLRSWVAMFFRLEVVAEFRDRVRG